MISIPGRIPIRIYPFFWILVLFIGWINSTSVIGTAIWAVVILVSVLIHEYGHALTALAFGQEARIELVGFGGVTHRQGPKLKFWQEFLLVINGPLAGFMLFLAAYYVRMWMGPADLQNNLWAYAVTITMYANLFWTFINLLPVHPLDGGRLLGIILEAFFGIRGLKAALLISSLIAFLMSLFFFLNNGMLAGALFLLLAFESYRAWQSSAYYAEPDQDDQLKQLLKHAEDNLRRGRIAEAKEQFEQVRSTTPGGVINITATEYLAEVLKRQGDLKGAYELLVPIKESISDDGLRLLHQLAFHTGALQMAISIGDRSYQAYPSYDTALTNALSYARLGNVQPAIGWLQRAIGDGLPNLRAILTKEEFDPIRKSPLFQELVQKYNR